MNERQTCGAKTRSGGACRRSPKPGAKRCNLHGGKSPQGIDHPRYTHGLYSKYAGPQLKNVLYELENVDVEELIRPDNEIKLMQALLLSAQALKSNMTDPLNLEAITKVIDRLIAAKQRSQAIMTQQAELIPASDIRAFFDYLERMLENRYGYAEAADIITELKSFKISNHATK